MNELKPCPFCGNNEISIQIFLFTYRFQCPCGCELDTNEETKEEAIEQWNNRAVIK